MVIQWKGHPVCSGPRIAAKRLVLLSPIVGFLAVAAMMPSYGRPTQSGNSEALHPGERTAVKISRVDTISSGLDSLYRVAWSATDQYFAVLGARGAGDDKHGVILVYETSSRRLIKTLLPDRTGTSFGDLAFSAHDEYLAGGTGVLTLWDTKTWLPVRSIVGPYERGRYASAGVDSIAFSPDGSTLGVLYNSIIFPESLRLETLAEITGVSRTLAAAKEDRSTYFDKLSRDEVGRPLQAIVGYDVRTAKAIYTFRMFDSTPARSGRLSANIVYSADGKYLLSSRVEHHVATPTSSDHYSTFLEYRDPTTGQISKEIRDLHKTELTAIAVSPDGALVATATQTTRTESMLNPYTHGWDVINNDDPIRIWRTSTGARVAEMGGLRGIPRALSFTKDGRFLLSSQTDISAKETLWCWDVQTGQTLQRADTPNSGTEVFSLAVSHDGSFAIQPVANLIYMYRIQQS